jgi:hypothetical protein
MGRRSESRQSDRRQDVCPHTAHRRTRRNGGMSWLSKAFGLGLMGLAWGCQLLGQDPARCDQSVSTVRQAISLKDFESARAWRDYTWKVCDERAVVATLDKEITDGEAALVAEAKAAAAKVQKQAQAQINRSQALWRKFDAEESAARTKEALDLTRKSAKRLEAGLPPTYSEKVRAYNEAEYQKRLAALSR